MFLHACTIRARISHGLADVAQEFFKDDHVVNDGLLQGESLLDVGSNPTLPINEQSGPEEGL